MTKRPILGALLGAAGVLAAVRAGAAGRELRLPELVDLSQEIVVGRVLTGKARWQGPLIVTSTAVRVDEALKGRPGRKIKVTQLGGTAVHRRLGAAVTMTASSYTALRPGEHVILFLEQQRAGRRGIVGAQQGKFLVRDEADTGRAIVPVAPKRLSVAREPARVTLGAETMTLDAMRDNIRALVAGAAIRPAGGAR
jgi:hypothetical protein